MTRLITFTAAAILSATPLLAQELAETPIGALIVHDESGGQNIPNFRYDAQHTAGGKAQITDATWRRIAPTLDIDLVKFPKAGYASEFDQDRVRWKLMDIDGVWPWACCNAKLREHLKRGVQVTAHRGEQPSTVVASPQRVQQDPPSVSTPMVVRQTDPFSPESKEVGSSFLITNAEEK